ncbi:hypothetical protein XI08_23005 [Bradyrhizobium sp. CCBAU 11361]|nr:hypothetical protein [Bradyrhizobium sp. CCBAU 11361]
MLTDDLAFQGRLEMGDKDGCKALDDVLDKSATAELGQTTAKPPGEIHLNQTARDLTWKDPPFQFTFGCRSGARISAAATQAPNPLFRIKHHLAVAVKCNLHWTQGDVHSALDVIPLEFSNLSTGQARGDFSNIGKTAPDNLGRKADR